MIIITLGTTRRAKAAKARQQQKQADVGRGPAHALSPTYPTALGLARGAPGQYPHLPARGQPAATAAAAPGYKPFAALAGQASTAGEWQPFRRPSAAADQQQQQQEARQRQALPPPPKPQQQQQRQAAPPQPPPAPKPAIRLVVDDDEFLAGELATLDAARQVRTAWYECVLLDVTPPCFHRYSTIMPMSRRLPFSSVPSPFRPKVIRLPTLPLLR